MGKSDMISFFKDLENECKNLKNELLKICWYMRGGVTYQESLALSFDDRQIIGALIKENLETTKKTGQPFF